MSNSRPDIYGVDMIAEVEAGQTVKPRVFSRFYRCPDPWDPNGNPWNPRDTGLWAPGQRVPITSGLHCLIQQPSLLDPVLCSPPEGIH